MAPCQSDLSGRRLAAAATFALALAAALAAVSVAGGADALSDGDEFTVDDINYKVTDVYDQFVQITGYEGSPVRAVGTVINEGSEWAVESVGDSAFSNCGSLEKVILPEAVSVWTGAFLGCGSLREASLPKATSVGDSAFQGCGSLEELSLPEAVSIGIAAFDGCDNLREASLPKATSVESNAFSGCENLKEVSLPSAESVGDSAFNGCGSLEEVILPEAVSIGGQAFWNCYSLKYVRFSGSLENVGEDAFVVSFYSGDEELDPNADSLRGREFVGTGDGKLYEMFIVDSVHYFVLSGNEVSAVGFEGSPTALSVPSSVEHGGAEYIPVSIGDGAFAGCGSAESVSIGDSVASIGENALGCPGLRSIEVSSGNAEFASEAGVLYDKDATVLIKFPSSKQRLVIPGTVEEIAPRAFENAGAALKAEQGGGDVSYFRYVAIPASVVKIGNYAFAGSTLECLKFAGGEVSVGESAFAGCSALNYVVFGAEFTEVGGYAFYGCRFFDGETEMALDDALAGHKFTGADAAHLDLYVPKAGGTIVSGDVKYRITDNGDSKTVVAVRPAGDNVANISVPASISYLGFGWEVTSIAPKAFLRNGSIVSVTSEVDVGRSAFHGCRNLEYVALDGAASVGAYAFFGCSSLEHVDLGGADTLGTSAFSGCGSLARIDLSGVTSIGKHAFFGCGSLTYADLPSVAFIGYGAFTGTDLVEVGFGGDLSHVDSKAFFGYSFLDGDGDKIKVNAGKLAGKHFSGGGKVLTQGP